MAQMLERYVYKNQKNIAKKNTCQALSEKKGQKQVFFHIGVFGE